MSAHDHAYAGRPPGWHSDLDISQMNPMGTSSPYGSSLNASPLPMNVGNLYVPGGNGQAYDPNSLVPDPHFGFLHQREDFASTADFNIKPIIGSSPCSRPSESDAMSSIPHSIQHMDWVQNMLEDGLRDLIHVLDRFGRILYTSACREITGYEREELTGRFISDFLHPGDSSIFARELNDSVTTGEPFRFFYRFKKRDNAYLILETYGRIHSMTTRRAGSNTTPAVHTVFSIIARPYPTSSTRLLDSFIEHKMENEQLTRRIAELKQEEGEEQYLRGRDSQTPVELHTSNPLFVYDSRFVTGSNVGSSAMFSSTTSETSTPSPARQRMEEPHLGLSPQGTLLRSSGSNSSSYLDDVELMTGLHYRAGERAHGISTGNPNSVVAHTAAPISLPDDKQDRTAGSGDRKRKMKTTEEYSCTDCGTLSSPEWRKGPNGRKTLCNACGLRWAKQEKRIQMAAAAKSMKREH